LDRISLLRVAAVTGFLWRYLCFAVVAAGVAGCAAPQGQEGTAGAKAEDVVATRSKARWQALIDGDVAKAYTYLSPGSREVYTLEAYRNSIRPGFWKSIDVETVECTGEICVVSTSLTYLYNGTTIKTPAKESWIREKGVWWYMHKS
jgi:hypothetical protein